MHVFKPGDSVRVVYTRENSDDVWRAGSIVTIEKVHIGHRRGGSRIDYTVITDDGREAFPLHEQLEPIVKLGSWDKLEETIGWNPTKQVETSNDEAVQSDCCTS